MSVCEVTFGNWVPVARALVELTSEWVGFTVIFYRGLVGEALLRVMTGVFIFETFKAANSDDELMILQKERQRKSYVKKMHKLFVEADSSGDGYLTWTEFEQIMGDPRVRTWLQAMELDVLDAKLLFQLVDNNDHKLSADELVSGFSRLRGPARSLELAICMNDINRLNDKVNFFHYAYQLSLPPRSTLNDAGANSVTSINSLDSQNGGSPSSGKLKSALKRSSARMSVSYSSSEAEVREFEVQKRTVF
jgi:hypothetical protein